MQASPGSPRLVCSLESRRASFDSFAHSHVVSLPGRLSEEGLLNSLVIQWLSRLLSNRDFVCPCIPALGTGYIFLTLN